MSVVEIYYDAECKDCCHCDKGAWGKKTKCLKFKKGIRLKDEACGEFSLTTAYK